MLADLLPSSDVSGPRAICVLILAGRVARGDADGADPKWPRRYTYSLYTLSRLGIAPWYVVVGCSRKTFRCCSVCKNMYNPHV